MEYGIAVEEVVGRIEVFCQELKTIKVKCTRRDVGKSFDDDDDDDDDGQCSVQVLISPEGDGKIEFVPATRTPVRRDEFHIRVHVGVKRSHDQSSKTHLIDVSLHNYSASNDGLQLVRRIHSLLQGEVCRTNRKWRRIRKTKERAGESH